MIDDEVVNFLLNNIRNSSKYDPNTMFIFPTYLSPFVRNFAQTGTDKDREKMIQFCRRQSGLKSSLFSYDIIFIPMNVPDTHWYLIVILNLGSLLKQGKKGSLAIIKLDSLNKVSVNFRPPEFDALLTLISIYLPNNIQPLTEEDFLFPKLRGLKVHFFIFVVTII